MSANNDWRRLSRLRSRVVWIERRNSIKTIPNVHPARHALRRERSGEIAILPFSDFYQKLLHFALISPRLIALI